jgi:hypothetical protein
MIEEQREIADQLEPLRQIGMIPLIRRGHSKVLKSLCSLDKNQTQ